jgi:hypothetical protein
MSRPRYSRDALAAAVDELRTIPQEGGLVPRQLEALDLAAAFLAETVGALDKAEKVRKRKAAQRVIEERKRRGRRR